MNKGIYFDLSAVYDDLNKRFFLEKIDAQLKWGLRRRAPGKTRRTIRLGSYHPLTKLITIHPCLDQAIVPRICVERIVFHEMLHQHFPIKKGRNGKNLIHYREFYDFEKRYPYLREADNWIKANLSRLLAF